MRTIERRSGRLARRLALAVAALCVLAAPLAGCDSTTSQRPPLSPTATATPSPTITPTALPGPHAAAAMLDQPPAQCPAADSQNQTMSFPRGFGSFSGSIEFVGQDIVWIPRPYYPSTLHLGAHGADSWPVARFLWEIGPNALDTVSVRVTDIETGNALWWIHSTPPDIATQTLVLDPNIPGPAEYHGQPASNWREWAATLLIPQASCYALEAKWDGGSWHVNFAAGR